jgi:hypothetical protein
MKERYYRSVDLVVCPTKSPLFGSIDSVRGTLLIDEADYDGDFRFVLIKLLKVVRSIVNQTAGEAKTRGSKRPLPLQTK